MPAALSIRARADADLDGCVAVLRRVHEHDGYPLRWPADPAAWLSPGRQAAAWVAEHDGLLAGHVALTTAHPGAAATAWSGALRTDTDRLLCVATLFVDPRQRGHGIGARLLAVAGQAAAARGASPVLEVVALNQHAVALYRSAGWQQVGAVSYDWLPPGVQALLFTGPSA